ncbi:Uncharacterized protein PECH_005385 [Penicillium ucsense]|uniref:WSC domain-containing protein n=1 Tax=Penicillium ucsense TaxID=2839758 RepID=A0A8J8WI29_9EURO|nr:Uncharacterized protein PECM_007617 [Penicillium ucsense]KAF7736408.1 Uncharacterized protein PECH_005385 [Penicillium ucsense]
MLFNNMWAALSISGLLLAANPAVAGYIDRLAPRNSLTLVGCYSSKEGLSDQVSYTFQSSGWCFDRCNGKKAAVFALTSGTDCLCGNELPPASAKVDSSKCNTACAGWPQDMCGGSDYFSLYTTGLVSDVPSLSATTTAGSSKGTGSSSGSGSSNSSGSGTGTNTNAGQSATSNPNSGSNGAPSAVTDAVGHTTTYTAYAEQKTTDISGEIKSSHNTAAIAAGVVVGIVGLAALAGAAFFFYRSKKQNAEGGFRGTAGGYGRDSQPPSMTDSRFDGDYMATRRQSNGSIDDDHDFSRRILQVTNPDRR